MELWAAGDFLLFLAGRATGADPPVLMCEDGRLHCKRVGLLEVAVRAMVEVVCRVVAVMSSRPVGVRRVNMAASSSSRTSRVHSSPQNSHYDSNSLCPLLAAHIPSSNVGLAYSYPT
jgi:hypothetical protein